MSAAIDMKRRRIGSLDYESDRRTNGSKEATHDGEETYNPAEVVGSPYNGGECCERTSAATLLDHRSDRRTDGGEEGDSPRRSSSIELHYGGRRSRPTSRAVALLGPTRGSEGADRIRRQLDTMNKHTGLQGGRHFYISQSPST